jgi:hypothetical protein
VVLYCEVKQTWAKCNCIDGRRRNVRTAGSREFRTERSGENMRKEGVPVSAEKSAKRALKEIKRAANGRA